MMFVSRLSYTLLVMMRKVMVQLSQMDLVDKLVKVDLVLKVNQKNLQETQHDQIEFSIF